jgi:lipid-binding SYLF domain-containing protein
MIAFRTLLGWILAFAAVADASGADDRRKPRAETQLDRIAVHFEILQSDPVGAIPPEILRDALALVIVRETRAGFVIGGKSGGGAMMVRGKDGWGAPALVRAQEGGVGLLAGWQSATFVQVLMSQTAVDAVRTNHFRFGVGVRVTSGPRSMGDEAKTRSAGSDVLVYSDTGGLYGGLAFEGGALRPDARANRDLYGLEAEEVLFGAARPAPTPAGRRLIEAVTRAPAATK